MKRSNRAVSAALVGTCLAILAGCGGSSDEATVSDAGQQDAASAPAAAPSSGDIDWPQHGLDAREQRHSPAAQITPGNVGALGLTWSYQPVLPDDGFAGTPIVVDGVVYMTGTFANVFAIDAVTGEELWTYNPGAYLGHGYASSWAGRRNHGVAVEGGKVFFGTPDCRLIALSAKTGEVIWEIQSCDPENGYAIAGAPRVAKDKVFIGNGISDFGARGYVTAYDTETGEQVWRFYTVPGDPSQPHENEILAMAAETWGSGWAESGGGCPWDAIVYDEELNQLYIGTDSGIPWDPRERSPGGGDNLFLNSIVALDVDTGKYKWHYQTVPEDAWDLNAASQIILTDLEIDGASRKVLMQAPKNGFFYVIDRETGKLVSANNYVPNEWASSIDVATGRPVEKEGVRYYEQDNYTAHISPMTWGAHNWHAMAFHPDERLVYIPAQVMGTTFSAGADSPLGGVSLKYYDDYFDPDERALTDEGKEATRGRLVAWDPVEQAARWEFVHEHGMNGGVVSTAGGLVFQGAADGKFRAHAAATGEELWSFDAGSAFQGGPVTYSVDGEQYVLVPAGSVSMTRYMLPLHGDNAGPTQLLAFKLGGSTQLPDIEPYNPPVPEPPEQTASAEQIGRGEALFEAASCALCHGSGGVGVRPGGSMPSLQYLSKASHAQFADILLKGVRKPLGMMPFADILSEQDVEDLHAFVIERQWELYNAQAGQ